MENLRPTIKLYNCSCQELPINSQELSKHLSLRKIHKITLINEETSNKSEYFRDNQICNHIKYLRLLSNVLNNRLNLSLGSKIFNITQTQLFIEQVSDFKNFSEGNKKVSKSDEN